MHIIKPKVASIIKHIIDSLFVIILAAIVVLVSCMFAVSYFDKSIKLASEATYLSLIILFTVISFFLGWIFPTQMIALVRSLRFCPKHRGLFFYGLLRD